MAGFVAGVDRGQATLLPECLEDWIDESNPVRAVDVFVEALDLRDLGFTGVVALGTAPPNKPLILLLATANYLGHLLSRGSRAPQIGGPIRPQGH